MLDDWWWFFMIILQEYLSLDLFYINNKSQNGGEHTDANISRYWLIHKVSDDFIRLNDWEKLVIYGSN